MLSDSSRVRLRMDETTPVSAPVARLVARWGWMAPPLAIAISVRVAIFLAVDFAAQLIAKTGLQSSFAIWHRFDVGFYVIIARDGYGSAQPVDKLANFFPLYPMAMSVAGHIVALFYHYDPYNVGGMIVSWLSFFAACVVLYRLVLDRFEQGVAYGAVLLFATFPFSFYYGISYTESLYMLVTFIAFLGIERRNWAMASIGAMLASAARPPGLIVGACVVVAYGLEWWRLRHGWRWDVLWLALTPAGALLYMLYCWIALGNPLAYKVASQVGWHGATLTGNNIVLAWHLFFGFNGPADFNTRIYRLYFALAALFLLSMVLVWRWLGPVYVLYSVPSILAPILTYPYPTSLGRYVSVIFPTFIVAALLVRKYPSMRTAIALFCAFFLALFALLFTMGYAVY